MSKSDRRVVFLICVVAFTGALASAGPEAPATALPGPLAINVPLAQEQLKLINQIEADLDRMYKGGELSLTDAAFSVWARRKVTAPLRASGAGKARIVEELENYLDRMKKNENAASVLLKQNQAKRVDLLAAKYERLEAEIWLNQEKAR